MAKTQFQNVFQLLRLCVYEWVLAVDHWNSSFFSLCVHRWLENSWTERTTELQILSELAAYSPNQSAGRGGATRKQANPEWGAGPWECYKCCYWLVCWSLRLWVSLRLSLLFLHFQWLLRSILYPKSENMWKKRKCFSKHQMKRYNMQMQYLVQIICC